MRLRIVHSLSFVLIGTVLLSVVVMGSLSAWQLQSGFRRYLLEQDLRRLDDFARFVSDKAERAGGLDAVAGNREVSLRLMNQFAEHLGIRPRPPAQEGEGAPRQPGVAPGAGQRPPHLPDGFAERVSVVRSDNSHLFGLELMESAQATATRPILLHGTVVGFAKIMIYPDTGSDAIDSKFLNQQYSTIALAALSLTAMAAVIARFLAQRDVRSLKLAQSAAQQIGSGKFVAGLESSRGDEIGDLLRMINGMADSLRADASRRTRWIADISHELRTPSTVLQGEIDALIDHVRPLEPNAIVSLREEVVRLTCLIDDLHLAALSELSAFPLKPGDCDAVALVQTMVKGYELRAHKMGIALQWMPPAQRQLPVHWDARRIEQLLRNLLENSLRYTDAPGRIVVGLESDGAQVVLAVEDSAPGISETEAEQIFLPLHRTESARARNAEGSGLGLAICQVIVQAHGGSIHAHASDLGGVRMQVQLPVQGKETI